MTVQSVDAAFPLRLGDAEDFARVRRFLRAARFEDEGVCRAMRVRNMAEVGAAILDPSRLADVEPMMSVLIRLFLAADALPVTEVQPVIDSATLASFGALDVLRRTEQAPDGTDAYAASVLLYPVAGMFIASDLGQSFAAFSASPLPDVVFPAFYHGTLRFLGLLPTDPRDEVLDLCAGSGIGALRLSRQARRAVAADITPRAVHFAQFNAVLNECPNVETALGDLYEAVPGQTFDLIVAHPPYVPAEAVTQIYRDAGVTGEAIMQRVVEGLPRFLRPGGAFHMVCAGWDTTQGSFEHRVRGWLGASQAEFDLVFAVDREMGAADVAKGLATRMESEGGPQRTDWARVFAEARLQRQVYGAVVILRTSGAGGGPVTRRVRLTDATNGAAFSWLVAVARWLDAEERAGTLTHLRPRVGKTARVNVVYGPQPGGLAPRRVVLQSEQAFGAVTQVDPWMLGMIARFDAQGTLEDIYRSTRETGAMPAEFRIEHLVKLVAMGIERGFFEVDACPPPPATPAESAEGPPG